jgi:hypothetical protein
VIANDALSSAETLACFTSALCALIIAEAGYKNTQFFNLMQICDNRK